MKVFLRCVLLCAFVSLALDSAAQSRGRSDSSVFSTNDTIVVKTLAAPEFFIRQNPDAPAIKFVQVDKGLDVSTILAILAVIISALAIYFPIRFNKLAERKSTFFKMYEYWNSDFLLKARRRFWGILEEKPKGEKIPLLELYLTNKADYSVYETIYDLLNDLAKLYNDHHVDRKLVKSVMIDFYRSYGNALKEHFIHHESKNSFLFKMSEAYSKRVTDLKEVLCKGEAPSYATPIEERGGMPGNAPGPQSADAPASVA